MASLKDFHSRLKPLIDLNKLQGFVAEEVFKVEPDLKVIKKRELVYGKRPDGSKIGQYKSSSYAAKKYAQNAKAGVRQVDLTLTGAFGNSAFLNRNQKSIFSFGFRDFKEPFLLKNFNTGMIGQKSIKSINQKSFDKIQKEIIAPKFFARLTRELGR